MARFALLPEATSAQFVSEPILIGVGAYAPAASPPAAPA